MKIFYCIPSLHKPGGMERILTAKANWLAEKGHDVTFVLTEGSQQPPYFPLHPAIKTIDLDIRYNEDTGVNPMSWHINHFRRRRHHARALTELLMRQRPDVAVSTFEEEAPLLWRIADGSRKVAEFHFSHGHRLMENRRGIRKFIDRMRTYSDGRTAARYDAFVVLTDRDKAYWPAMPGIRVVPNFPASQPDLFTDHTPKRVIAAGRLVPQKGFGRLIEIWSRVAHDFPDWRLDIFGDGPLRSELQAQIDSLGIAGSATLRKPVKNLYAEMAQSSIYAMTSVYEGFPMVLVEAASAGLCPVSFDIDCGPSSVIADGQNGFLIADNDFDTYAARLRELMSSEPLRRKFGMSARASASRFARNEIMQTWLRIFEGKA